MDIVIPLGTESRWHDNELRFTLRSIEKHLTGYRNVIIVGWCPPWVQNVVHIKKEDWAGKKNQWSEHNWNQKMHENYH